MRRYTITIKGKPFVVEVDELAADRFQVALDGQTFEVELTAGEDLPGSAITPAMPTGGVTAAPAAPVTPAPRPAAPSAPTAPSAPAPRPAAASGGKGATLNAPMPGTITAVEVTPGAVVTRGQVLLSLEAMKMNNAIRATRDGVVADVLVVPGQAVAYGEVLLRFAEGQS